ncbi:LOW QUALITY PROTEIN: protein FAM178B [Lagopus muta]|uniref:LOW QUALITY PROTEIN: protein FAM178B n=1 Tax=Lagopus muta TaxID=64668 RepID=UPI0020A09D87|nr:LOW QUALITY PROTEIN: protein FAM178B [Lagopus muta]
MLRGASARRGQRLGLLRWYQIPLSSARVPRSGLFSSSFQYSLCSYQQLRVSKHLRVGRPFLPPPLGPVDPHPPASPPPPQPHSAEPGEACPGCPMQLRSTRQGPSRARRPRAGPRRSAQQGSATRSPRSAARPSSATESRTVPQRAEDVATTSSSDSEEELIPLKELLACSGPSSPAEHSEVACPQPDPLANSLDALLLEKREQRVANAVQASLTQASMDSIQESSDEDMQLLEEQRAFLSRFNMKLLAFPATHPGEPIFHACPLPPPTLDTRGLQPRSVLEQNFLDASPASQLAFVRDGYLQLLYQTTSACPPPILRWLFQLTSTRPDRSNAFRTLWEMWMRSDDEPWCPTLQDVGQVFAYMGADLQALRCRRLLPPELCPMDTRLDPKCSLEQGNPGAVNTLALVTQLGDVCKLLTVCVLACPCRYPDRARRELVTLLCFLSLDRELRCQPLPDVWHLLHCLLEGIAAWKEQLPALCLSLCRLSRHHHNLLAVARLLPDITARQRELRRRLSLCAMAQLLGKAPCTVLSLRAQEELPALEQLLAQSWPDSLQLPTEPEATDVEQETCYLSRSLLYLADVVVGTERPRNEQKGHLEKLCTQLEQYFGSWLREDMGQFYRSQLKNLAMVLYVKWHELLK